MANSSKQARKSWARDTVVESQPGVRRSSKFRIFGQSRSFTGHGSLNSERTDVGY